MKGGLFLNEMFRVLLSTPTERERETGEGGRKNVKEGTAKREM